jgi:hypothetical protein
MTTTGAGREVHANKEHLCCVTLVRGAPWRAQARSLQQHGLPDPMGNAAMNLHNINRRLDRLDSARPVAERRVVTVVREADESVADAIARWCEAHPDEPPPVDEDNTLIILRTLVAPKPAHPESPS